MLNFLEVTRFCFLGYYLLLLAMTLNFGLKVKLLDSFSLEQVLPPFCQEYQGEFDKKCQKASYKDGR